MRPLPSRNTLGADSTYFTDTGGYGWEVRPDTTVVAIASPGGAPYVFTPSSPGYAATLAQVQRGTVATRAGVIALARTRGGMEVGKAAAPAAAVPVAPAAAPAAPAAPAATTATPVNVEGMPVIPGWVLPAAAAAGVLGLALVMLPGSRNSGSRDLYDDEAEADILLNRLQERHPGASGLRPVDSGELVDSRSGLSISVHGGKVRVAIVDVRGRVDERGDFAISDIAGIARAIPRPARTTPRTRTRR